MKVLLVVAEQATRQQLEEFFSSRRHGVVTCTDSASAREHLERASCPYVLIDLEVDAGAVELCRWIRELPDGDAIYTLVLPRAESIEAMRAALEGGADDYLPKPVGLAALQLRLAIGERRLAARQQKRVTARRLEHSERRHRTVIETMHEGIFQVDPEGIIEFANSRLSDITGYSLNELIGESADELLVEPEVRERLPEQRLLGSGTGSEEYSIPIKTKSSEPKWVNLTGAPVPTLDGQPCGSFGIIQDITEQRNAEEALRYREQYFRALLENSSDLITILDIEGRILYQSTSSQRLLGWDAEELVGRSFFDYLHSDDHQSFSEVFNTAIELSSSETTAAAQFRFRHHSDEWRSLESLCNNLIENPVVGGLVVTSRDITEHRRVESELQRERVLFQQLLRNSPTGIVIFDNDGRVVDCNRSFVDLFQFQLDEIKKQPLSGFIVPEELHDEATEFAQAVSNKQTIEYETTRQRKDDSKVEVSIVGYPIVVSDRRIGAFGIYSDITERKKAERRLFHGAFHDALTGLPNRSLLNERLERALRRSRRRLDYQFALLFIDLDHFKEVNDKLGHAAGDELLVETARRLDHCLRPGDTVARLGGDEFTIILEDLQHMSDATRVADRIIEQLAEPFHLGDQQVKNSGSIGIAYSATGYKSVDDLVRDADMAMYRAKAAGKGRYEIFDTKMHRSAVERLQLERELSRAIELKQLVLNYQPVVSLTTRQVVGFEAFVHWQHPQRGVISSEKLVSVCEETGLIVSLGRWVFREACRQVVAWQERFPDRDCILVTINLSAPEISHPKFLEQIDQISKEMGVKRSSIGLEISESVLVKAEKTISNIIWQLHKRGFRLNIDDFGTGYSSLSSLHRFPIDTLKIDRTFVQHMTPGGEQLEVVRTIAAIGESQGLNVVAVGVETQEQFQQLRRLELPFAQGFLFSRPVSVEAAEKLITSEKLWPEPAEEA
ncbi:MAG: EAL domain-containing protein [bacterium]|nr:EAL domain-containing protein [bacterium]